MDLTRTTDHIQSRSGFTDHNTAPRALNKSITNLSEFKGFGRPRGQSNVGHAPAQHARSRLQSTDTLPPSLIARMAKGVLANQRRQLASLPSGSRDTRIAKHYKASYVLEDRGGATAPGAELSLRPTGKASGGMDNPASMTKNELRTALDQMRANIRETQTEYERQMNLADNARTNEERRHHLRLAEQNAIAEYAFQRQFNAINCELEARSGGAGSGGSGPRF